MRRDRILKRRVGADSVLQSFAAWKIINNFMTGGEKRKAQKIFYEALSEASKEIYKKDDFTIAEQLELLNKVIANILPQKTTTPRKFGGVTYQIPTEIPVANQVNLAIKLLRTTVLKLVRDKGITTTEALKNMFIESYKNTGAAVEAKNALHQLANANIAFSHFGRNSRG